jgi:aminopeptidase N
VPSQLQHCLLPPSHVLPVLLPAAGQPLAQGTYTVTDSNLALLQPPDRQFTLQITNTLSLRWATGSVGIARSISGTYITQCESEGFRRLTYFLDRPDVRSNFTVRIEADESACPVLLSNGNLKEAGKLPGGRHYAVYEVRSVLSRAGTSCSC